jgi:hypothetical protein
VTFSSNVPLNRQPVSPGERLRNSRVTVRNGKIAVPGLELRPQTAAYLLQSTPDLGEAADAPEANAAAEARRHAKRASEAQGVSLLLSIVKYFARSAVPERRWSAYAACAVQQKQELSPGPWEWRVLLRFGYLRPTTRFTLAPFASLLPALGL